MAKQEHVDILKQGVDVWNNWADENETFELDLSEVNLSYFDLRGINLSGVNLARANLNGADLCFANLVHADVSLAEVGAAKLRGANFNDAFLHKTDFTYSDLDGATFCAASLKEANLSMTNLTSADFSRANLTKAQFRGAHLIAASLIGAKLHQADLREAIMSGSDLRWAEIIVANLNEAVLQGVNLTNANLGGSNLVKANLTNAILENTFVYGIAAWDIKLNNTTQLNLVITPPEQPKITVDNLEIAQFIYLLLNNQKIRNVIDTITSKVVLILGRFTPERKPVLDALRDELRNHNYSPVVFDFEPSAKRDLTETISTLAHMSRFVIADLTDAKSVPQELQVIVPHLPSVPIQPILHRDATEYAMFEHYERYPWVLPIYRYQDISSLLSSFKERILRPIEQKEYEKEKARSLEEENRKLKERIKELEELSS